MRRSLIVSAVLVCALVLVGPASAADYNDAATGNWDAGDTWATSPLVPVTGDDAVIDSHQVTAGHDVGGNPYIIPDLNSLTIRDSGVLYLRGADSTQLVDMTLKGGKVDTHRENSIDNVKTLAGDITVASGTWSHSTIEVAVREDLDIAGSLLGDGHLYLQGGLLQGDLRLSGDNTAFTGEITLVDDNEGDETRYYDLRIQGADALEFSGTVTIHGKLQPEVAPTGAVQPKIIIGEHGLYNLKDREGVSFVDTDWDMTFDGGRFSDDNVAHGSDWEHSGAVVVESGGATFGQGYANITLSGTVSGPGKLTFNSGNAEWWAISNPNNSISGGIDVKTSGGDKLRVLADGALGAGTVTVYGGGVLRTDPAGGTAQAAISSVTVVVNSGGTLQVNSTETAANVTLQRGAIMEDVSDTTTFDYDNNFHVEAGAIFKYDEVAEDLPAITQIAPDGNDDRYIYKGDSGSFASGDYTVGTGTSVRGLAAIGAVTMYSGVVVHEVTAGGGFDLFAPAGNSIALRGVVLDGTGAASLTGNGDFQMGRYNDADNTPCFSGTVTTIDKYGTGRIWFNNPGCVNGDHTINVHAGYVDFGRYSSGFSDALGTSTNPDDWATVNVKEGALFYSEYAGGIQLSRGKITVETGGASYDVEGYDDGAQWTFQPGSQIVVSGDITTGSVVGSGNPDYFLSTNASRQLGVTGSVDVVLSDDNRITSNAGGSLSAAGGDLVLASGVDEGVVSAANGTRLILNNKVNMPGGTLVIGAAGTFTAFVGHRYNQPYTQTENITQDGDVELTNAANDIGLIDVRYGRLRLDNGDPIQGLDVHLSSTGNGVLYPGSMDATDVTFTGDGPITWNGSNWGEVLGGTINPGGNPTAGTLTLSGRGLSMQQGVATGSVQIVLDVVGDGGAGTPTAGMDYDQLVTPRWVDVNGGDPANVDLTVRMPLPSKDLVPDNLSGDTLTVLSIGDGSGFNLDTDPLNSAEVKTDGDPSVGWTGTVNQLARSVTVTDLTWTARKGNANLDNIVDVLDLARLANNFGRDDDDVDWGTADFNFDGAVDVLDLAAIANNFGQSGSVGAGDGGGAPVPEPGSAVLLVLGLGGVLLRRRRRS